MRRERRIQTPRTERITARKYMKKRTCLSTMLLALTVFDSFSFLEKRIKSKT